MNCIQVMIRKRLKKNIPLVFAVFTYIVILPSKIARLDGFFEERFFLVKSVKTSPTKVIWLKKVCLHSHFLSYPWYVLLRTDVRGDFNIHGIKYFKMLFSVKYQKNMISTVCDRILYPPSFLLEIRVIIKILKNPWYPINCGWFE